MTNKHPKFTLSTKVKKTLKGAKIMPELTELEQLEAKAQEIEDKQLEDYKIENMRVLLKQEKQLLGDLDKVKEEKILLLNAKSIEETPRLAEYCYHR